ncbi:MAG TPA: S1 RNA-binding domain-containing protein [Clostridiaceae bacterium]|nr:S1 RNA-binding domain-containing protein [Clostridiaceae bacterium]
MPIEVGKIVKGRVSGITSFGAFIKLKDGKVGLVHISEIADEYVKDVASYLKENQIVKVKVISIDDKGKISLSIKRANEESKKVKSGPPEEFDWGKPNNLDKMSFEERLSKFLKDSDEKMLDLKKSIESKRKKGSNRKYVNY